MPARFRSIDAYIETRPPEIRPILEDVRRAILRAILRAAPAADETINYQMPTFTIDGKYLVHFAAWRNHVGLYPAPAVDDETLWRDLAPYRAARGTLRFPYDEPLLVGLIERVVGVLLRQQRAG